jgi:diguanylate cyclase (GGDEF)-like protein
MSPFRSTTEPLERRDELGTSFGAVDGALFSREEVQRLMRIEFERAQRYHYPLACFLIAVDRLERLHDVHGLELKLAILERITGLLRSEIRSSDLLGCPMDDRLLVMLPHAPREGVDQLARRLLSGARKLQFEADGRAVRVSLSIGGAHNQLSKELYYQTLIQVAEGGLAVALAGGGDRYVHSELYEHFQRKLEREKNGEARLAPLTGFAPPAPPPLAPPGARDVRQIIATSAAASPAEISELEAKLLAAQSEREQLLAAKELEHREQIDRLERRIAKLTQLLEKTEEDLQRIAALKNVDPGLASVYRTVQGLSSEEEALALKRELMKEIFQANLELKHTIAGQP